MESMYKKRKKDNTALIQHFQEKLLGRLLFSRKAGKRPLPLKLKTISTRYETNVGFKRCLFRVHDTIHKIDLVTVFDGILTSRQTREKLQ